MEQQRSGSGSGFQVAPGAPQIYEDAVWPVMRPFVEELVDQLVAPGLAVLDVACGTGFVTRAAAGVLGDTGRLAAVDVNPAMLQFAAGVAGAAGARVEWCHASALDLPFEDASFDAVLCQQGCQFFPDPVAGLAEMRRVSRPGGRTGVTVWAPLEHNPYLVAQMGVLVEQAGMPPAAFAQAAPAGGAEGLADWLRQAGWTDVDARLVERRVELPPVADYFLDHLRALPWSGPLFELDDAGRAAIVDAMSEELRDHIGPDGRASMPLAVVLATATA